MTRISRLRPSPAMAVALVALFLSLGGVSYGVATGFIDSREIKNNTIRTQDVRNNELRGFDIRNSTVRGTDVALNTLDGRDVNESRLGKVPAAEKADSASTAASAATAANANTVGGVGVQKIAFSTPEGTAFTPVLEAGGLIVEADCQAAGALTLRARTTQAGSALLDRVPGVDGSDGDFAPGDNAIVVAPLDANNPGEGGELLFRGSGGATVTVELYALGSPDSIPGSATDDCGVFGVAFVG